MSEKEQASKISKEPIASLAQLLRALLTTQEEDKRWERVHQEQ